LQIRYIPPQHALRPHVLEPFPYYCEPDEACECRFFLGKTTCEVEASNNTYRENVLPKRARSIGIPAAPPRPPLASAAAVAFAIAVAIAIAIAVAVAVARFTPSS
jgi:hypothetical protein